jgi:Ca-activated chloride channel family protein
MVKWSVVATMACALVVLHAPGAAAQTASVKAAATAEVGSTLEVHWSGPAAKGDFISIDEAGAPDSTYGPYQYPSAGNPLTLEVPTSPGKYEVRYHTGANGYPTLAKAAVEVTDVSATLEAPASVEAGGSFKVKWKGPGHPGDFISIDAVGAPERTYGNYDSPSKGNLAEIRAPDEPGDYVVRYHLAGSYRVVGSVPIKVGGVAATLKFPATARAGGMLAVAWTGPGAKGDFISIDAAGAPDRTYGSYDYPARGNPLQLRIPDEAGDYDERYHH